MFRKEGKGGRKGGAQHSKRHQPAHSKEGRYTPEEQEELLQPLNTGMMEALVDQNERSAHQLALDPFEPSDALEAYEELDADANGDASAGDALASGEPAGYEAQGVGPEGDAPAEEDDEIPSIPGFGAEDDAAFEMPELSQDEPESAPEPAAVPERGSEPVRAVPATPAQAAGAQDVNPIELSRYQRGDGRYTHRKSRSSRKKRLAIGIVACLVAVFGVFGGLAFAWWQTTAGNIGLVDPSIQEELKEPVVSEPYWTLILGSDSRENAQEGSRSDVILLARIDQAGKKVTLVSIPRDTKVTINGQTMKINAAYGVGGPKQAIATIEEFAGIEISHYVEIYFDGFSTLVDQLGGIEVDVPQRASYHGVTIEPGLQTLDGKEALTLARVRKSYVDGDFTRTKMQRLLVQALISKVLQQDVSQIPGTINAISNCFSTDIPLQDLVSLATSLQGMGSDSIYMAMAPSTTGMIGAASYTFTYIDQWKLIMQKANEGEDPNLSEKEAELCGTRSTKEYDLDMAQPIDEDVMAALEEYWQEEQEKALAEQQEQTKPAAAEKGGKAASGKGVGSPAPSE